MTPLVEVAQAAKEYWLGNVQVPALKGVDLVVQRGEFLAIAGPSGSGKTTLLNLIGCIEMPTSGTVRIDQVDIATRSSDELAVIRAVKLGFIFQNFNLLPVLTALENVEYPLATRDISSRERRRHAQEALASVGLAAFERHKPLELSGGQRQRVAIARALVGNPSVILADEPTGNLDSTTAQEIMDLLLNLNREQQVTLIIVTHDPHIADRLERKILVRNGVVREAGRP